MDEPHPRPLLLPPRSLKTGEQAEPVKAVAIGVEFGDASDDCARPAGRARER